MGVRTRTRTHHSHTSHTSSGTGARSTKDSFLLRVAMAVPDCILFCFLISLILVVSLSTIYLALDISLGAAVQFCGSAHASNSQMFRLVNAQLRRLQLACSMSVCPILCCVRCALNLLVLFAYLCQLAGSVVYRSVCIPSSSLALFFKP